LEEAGGGKARDRRTPQPTAYGVPRTRFRFLWENDSWFTGSDRFYTNGIGAGITLRDGALSDGIRDALTWLPFRGEPGAAATEFFLRQDMYTPEDYENPNSILDDRPYAGWLHLDVEHQLLTMDSRGRRDRLDTWRLTVGVVGPASLAEKTQKQVHEIVNAPDPKGWDYQLKNEFGLLVGYRRAFRAFFDDLTFAPLENDFIGSYGFNLGNVETSVLVGSELRLGLRLPRHFGTAVRPLSGEEKQHRLYLTGGAEGSLVFRNIFLDGNTFRSSQDVDRNIFVARFHAGFAWEPCDNGRIRVREVFVTPEFDSPSRDGDVAHFTSVQVEIFF
jgi:hypothetical protein